jgi:hypothetical protein
MAGRVPDATKPGATGDGYRRPTAAWCPLRSLEGRTSGDEHVLAAVVREWFTGEPAMQGFQFEASDIEQP